MLFFAIFPAFAQEVLQERIVLYVFHPGYDSFINGKIEKSVLQTVKEHFSADLDAGLLEVREVDLSFPENENYIKKYGLNRGSMNLVISAMQNFKEVRYKNYDEIWKYAQKQEPDLKKYILTKTQNFINLQKMRTRLSTKKKHAS